MKTKNTLISIVHACLAGTTAGVLAEELPDLTPATDKKAKKDSGNCCEALKDLGEIYDNKKNPWIQKLEFSGRIHQQWGYTDGSDNGRDFSNDGYDLRRLRLGFDLNFLHDFTLESSVNFERGGFRDSSIGFDGFDQLHLTYDFGDLGAFKKVEAGYGRYKLGFGGEETTSSNEIKTIERSLLNNEFAGDRTTGARVSFEVGDNIDFILGVYTTDADAETFGNWNGGTLYHVGSDFDALGGHLDLQAYYSDASETENEVLDYRWAVSATHETEIGSIDLFTNATYGEDYNGDAVYGVVIMHSTELIEDKLEAVLRYQWAYSEEGDLRPQKRNVGAVATDDFGFGMELPKGRRNHNIYAGLNYFLCDHNAKAMFGVEYESNSGAGADTEATTVWGALRFSF
ncbi:OprO/OprP family phosphate-selective porin [Akkermansiaceae bacterium]|nr:OprO/OprP family phosphate-selective porin [Akkermansiaceae bacterium]MDA7888933.1 OprO/OprP family phosphate-selective porin [Akkermansiaceae bacterium]MDB4537887.1 OprO/OprP family phosphate-selective porin [Akkermansiaceae bacterium]